MSRDEKLLVVAFGGNAFQSKSDRGTPQEYWRNAERASKLIVELVNEGYKIVITHGNGPQVGIIAEWMLAGLKLKKLPPMTLDVAGAMTQGWLGYLLQQTIHNSLVKANLLGSKVKGVVAVITQVLINKDDPAFKNPTKYIGPWYEEDDAEKLMNEYGWVMKPDPRGGFRRVVPSPDPVNHVEISAIKKLVNEGFIVIASGGGGIPVVEVNGKLFGVEAVIDKDLAGERLASALGASIFMILTDVDKVYLNYGKMNQTPLSTITVSEAEKYLVEGHFAEGSMGPKVLACIRFIRNGGKAAIIGHLYKGIEALRGESGTRIIPDFL
ncbi:MAG: carbamate kinase [Desulfurococcaceae archaeon]